MMNIENEIVDKYVKQQHDEHILNRPGTYIGSVEYSEDILWTLDDKYKTLKMKKKELNSIPGLIKIIDEIALNAWDQYIRLQETSFKVSRIVPYSFNVG